MRTWRRGGFQRCRRRLLVCKYVVSVEEGQERWDMALFGESTSSPLKVTSTTGEAYNLLSRHLHHPPSCYAYPRPHSSRSIHHAIQRPPSAPVPSIKIGIQVTEPWWTTGVDKTTYPSASLADSRSRIYPSELSFTRRMASTLPDLSHPRCSLRVIVGQRCGAHGKSH